MPDSKATTMFEFVKIIPNLLKDWKCLLILVLGIVTMTGILSLSNQNMNYVIFGEKADVQVMTETMQKLNAQLTETVIGKNANKEAVDELSSTIAKLNEQLCSNATRLASLSGIEARLVLIETKLNQIYKEKD